MKLKGKRIDLTNNPPSELTGILFLLGHWLASRAPDLKANFNVTEGEEVIQYEIEVREVKRYNWLVEGEVTE